MASEKRHNDELQRVTGTEDLQGLSDVSPVVAGDNDVHQRLDIREKSKFPKDCVGAYAVQCAKCFKWRLVPSLEEYETIRETFIEQPWHCERRLNITCDHPDDIEYDATRLWIIDKPNLPKAPRGTKRGLSLRRDLSKLDVHYVMPGGKKVRCGGEVEKFLDAHPEYKGKLSVSSFAFTPPKILEDMVPRNLEGKTTSKNKRLKAVDDEDS